MQREKLRGFVVGASVLPNMMEQSCSFAERPNNMCDITEKSEKLGFICVFF